MESQFSRPKVWIIIIAILSLSASFLAGYLLGKERSMAPIFIEKSDYGAQQ